MASRIFRSVMLTAIICVMLTAALLVPALYTVYEDSFTEQMRREADCIAYALETYGDDREYLAGLDPENRITLIAADGSVIYDSDADESSMENHLNRPEVHAALTTGSGRSTRHSDTLSDTTIYYAVLTPSGSVLRVAGTRSSILGIFMNVMPHTVIILLCIVILSFIVARFSAKRIVLPINRLDLDDPVHNDVYEELTPLLTRMEFQHIEIKRQMAALERARTQFDAIMANMREGLVLLDTGSTVLSINESAARIFGVQDRDRTGCSLLEICRDIDISELAKRALQGEYGDILLRRGELTYRMYASPVMMHKKIQGIVLLILDITERFVAEASRREFTANVSHELKTPLTSISGYAEIIRDGIALPDDIPAFAGRILNDTKRLIALVNDILELSRLDEKQLTGDPVPVNITSLIGEAAAELSDIADRKQLQVSLSGDNATVTGHEKLLRELFHNIIENAIKYTPDGGSIDISVSHTANGVCCTVADTGIGIPAEHQPHVFERFYRVDKSHSRATGGTGLGLAIVKHVAEIHNAALSLTSSENVGTTISVTFPA